MSDGKYVGRKKYIKNLIFNLYSRNSSKDVISLTEFTHSAITCSNVDAIDVVLVSLLLTLNIFHTLF